MSSDLSPEQKAAERAAAFERSWRALRWGLLVDVATAVTLVMLTGINAIEWTGEYWAALGLAVAKSVITAVVTFFARLLIKPKEA